jgi:hypothetical protein
MEKEFQFIWHLNQPMPIDVKVIKETEKAVHLQNEYTGRSTWVPKKALINHGSCKTVQSWFRKSESSTFAHQILQ